MAGKLTHLDETGRARMVNVTAKPVTDRVARARGVVYMRAETLDLIQKNKVAKGNVLEVARLGGIMAAKRTGHLIPLCHPLAVTHVDIRFAAGDDPPRLDIESEVHLSGKTGVEMEALTAVAVAALTIYDMCKAVDKEMTISQIQLLAKKGGKSGVFVRPGVTL